MQHIRKEMAKLGIENYEAVATEAGKHAIQEMGVQLLGSTLSVLSGCLIIILFLGFLLIDSASERSLSKEPWRPFQRRMMKQILCAAPRAGETEASVLALLDDSVAMDSTFMGRLRLQMRIYIQQKFYLSVLKAFLIGLLFAILRVDLWLVWTLLTFVLNFVPLGSSISTLAPMPFVILDPDQRLLAICACIAWPLLVHNVVGNVVEPRLFASTLCLHPVTVLLALTFWTALWGVVGAVVCVPITAVVRVALRQASHPYAEPVLRLLEGVVDPGESRQPANDSATVSGNPIASARQ